ncbi:MAG: hypothetical protein GU356_04720 [Pyrobaculum sp.]|nr:hypothetical protein [Pyrobaculum sp.]
MTQLQATDYKAICNYCWRVLTSSINSFWISRRVICTASILLLTSPI